MAQELKHNRLVFIDIARSIAILMMLEGHFIVMALGEEYRGDNYLLYEIWRFTRGLTAPLFFTVAGLVFTYLLVRKEAPFFSNIRVKKGFSRGVQLIFWGYLLQLNIFYLIKGSFSGYLYVFHVLQCIGASLIVVLLLHGLQKLLRVVPFALILAVGGVFGFILKPTIYQLDFSNVHPVVENIFVITAEDRTHKSIFALFPWLGFTLLGAALGAFVSTRPHKVYTLWFPVLLVAIGVLLNLFSDSLLALIQPALKGIGMKPFVGLGYLFARFGQVLAVLAIIIITGKYKREIGVFYRKKLHFLSSWWLSVMILLVGLSFVGYALYLETLPTWKNSEFHPMLIQGLTLSAFGQLVLFIGLITVAAKLVKWNYDLFIKMGQNTLSIYIVHVIILYGGIFGFGLSQLFQRSMDPWTAIIGAVIFMLIFVYFIRYLEDIKEFYKRIIPSFKK